MITFFRKIQYDLIEKNPPAARVGKAGKHSLPADRFIKYLLYAIA
jgi:hypothetical protein